MSEGFFSEHKIQSVEKRSLPYCGSCGLWKHCKSPKMKPSGKGRRKILLVGEAVGKEADKNNVNFYHRAKSTIYIKKLLKRYGIDIYTDCWSTNALICKHYHEPYKQVKAEMITACQPNLMQTIARLKPNVVLLLGEVASKSLLTEAYQNSIGTITRWHGYCIPCRKPNIWIIPTFHPTYILDERSNKVIKRMFRNHIKTAIEKCKSKPWNIIPDYKNEIEIIVRPSKAARVIKQMERKGGVISFDYEANCLKPWWEKSEIVSCSICWMGKKTISYPFTSEAISATSNILKNPNIKKIAQNISFENKWTKAKLGHWVRGWFWDTMLNAHLINNVTGITGLNFQSFVNLGQERYDKHIHPFLVSKKNSPYNRIHQIILEDLLLYGGLDGRHTYKIANIQYTIIRRRYEAEKISHAYC